MHQICAVGDARKRIDAGSRQQSIDVSSVAGGTGDDDPGQGHGPGGVAERTVGGGREPGQLGVVETVDEVEQTSAGRNPSADVGGRTHSDLAVGLEQQPADAHADQIGSETGPRFVVDLVEQRQWVVGVGHVIVDVGEVGGGRPGGYHEDG